APRSTPSRRGRSGRTRYRMASASRDSFPAEFRTPANAWTGGAQSKPHGQPDTWMRAGFERAALVLGTPIVAILVAGCSLLAAQSPPPPAEQPPDRPFDRDGVLAVVNAYQAAHPDAI